jgi:hypothetical protein
VIAMTISRIPVLLAAVLLASCVTPYALVEPKSQTVGGVISVEPGMKWNKMSMHGYKGKVEVWTLDGPTLNTLVFFTGVPDGEPLLVRGNVAQKGDEQPPVFKSTMNPLEVQELLEATMARNFSTSIAEARNPNVQTIADGKGFRFETRLVGRDEVERHGVFTGTVRQGKLYGAWFQGAKLHYFERYLPEYDRIIASAKLVGEAAK